MEKVTVTLTKMAHGGKAFGRNQKRTIFIPGTIPGERVQAELVSHRKGMAEGQVVKVIERSPDRVEPKCDHFGRSGDCSFQHLNYAAQIKYKTAVIHDQFERIGKLKGLGKLVRPMLHHPQPWQYRIETTLSPTDEGELGYWSPTEQRVLAIRDCHRLHPSLRAQLREIDLDLEDLRKLTLRVGADGERMIVFNVNNAEPPHIEIDAPLSIAIVMPDGVAATLIGDPYLVQTVEMRNFRVSAGSFFHSSLEGAELLVQTVLGLADLQGDETVIEGYSGVGMLTAFLAEKAATVIAIEKNPDSIEDAAVNLDDTENVALYNDWIENALPLIADSAELIILDVDADGLSQDAGQALIDRAPSRIIYSSPNVASTARDAAYLSAAGYKLTQLQPIDMEPQTHHVHTVGLWKKKIGCLGSLG